MLREILCEFGIHDYKYFRYKNEDFRICECGKLQLLQDDPYNYDHHWQTCEDHMKTSDILLHINNNTDIVNKGDQRKQARLTMLRNDIERYFQNEVFIHMIKNDHLTLDKEFIEKQFRNDNLFFEIGHELGYKFDVHVYHITIKIDEERRLTQLEEFEQDC